MLVLGALVALFLFFLFIDRASNKEVVKAPSAKLPPVDRRHRIETHYEQLFGGQITDVRIDHTSNINPVYYDTKAVKLFSEGMYIGDLGITHYKKKTEYPPIIWWKASNRPGEQFAYCLEPRLKHYDGGYSELTYDHETERVQEIMQATLDGWTTEEINRRFARGRRLPSEAEQWIY